MRNRTLLPGDSCLYCKFYTSEHLANMVLMDLYNKIITKNNEIIKSFFFVRYQDPYFHLRMRFFIEKNTNISVLLRDINSLSIKLYKDKKIWKMQVDTYEREIERYNSQSIGSAELFFYKESILICEILKKNQKSSTEEIWPYLIWVMDFYLTSSSLCLKSKITFVENVANSYKSEFGFGYYNSKCLNKVYRDNKNIIFKVLDSKDYNGIWCELEDCINEYKLFCDYFFRPFQMKNIIDPCSDDFCFVQSLIHMLNNRAFVNYNRLHEMLLYEFLLRYYKSKLAIDSLTLEVKKH